MDPFVAYTAGFVDGEGCIGLRISKGRTDVRLDVSIANTNRQVLILLQKRWGGALHLMRKESVTRKRAWYLRISGYEALGLLKRIEPFMIVKRKQVELALTWETLPRFVSKGRGSKMSARMRTLRKKMAMQMALLNRRGPG